MRERIFLKMLDTDQTITNKLKCKFIDLIKPSKLSIYDFPDKHIINTPIMRQRFIPGIPMTLYIKTPVTRPCSEERQSMHQNFFFKCRSYIREIFVKNRTVHCFLMCFQKINGIGAGHNFVAFVVSTKFFENICDVLRTGDENHPRSFHFVLVFSVNFKVSFEPRDE